MDISLFGIALMPLIVALVELAKTGGLPSKYAPYLTGTLAVVGFSLSHLIELNPTLAPTVEYWLNIVIVFLSASGLFSIARWGKQQVTAGKVEATEEKQP